MSKSYHFYDMIMIFSIIPHLVIYQACWCHEINILYLISAGNVLFCAWHLIKRVNIEQKFIMDSPFVVQPPSIWCLTSSHDKYLLIITPTTLKYCNVLFYSYQPRKNYLIYQINKLLLPIGPIFLSEIFRFTNKYPIIFAQYKPFYTR